MKTQNDIEIEFNENLLNEICGTAELPSLKNYPFDEDFMTFTSSSIEF